MKLTLNTVAIAFLGVLSLLPHGIQAKDLACRPATPGWVAMQNASVILSTIDGRFELAVRIADAPDERMAGYQWICPQTAENTAVLFVYRKNMRAGFHMKNVFVPLRIAFFDGSGRLVDTMEMAPSPPRGPVNTTIYHAKGAFRYVLEVPTSNSATAWLADRNVRLLLD